MTELLWQTILLLAGAFFFGAVLACSLKRRFYYGPPASAGAAARSGSLHASVATAPDAAQPKIEVASQPAAEGQRFERAVTGAPSASAAAAAPRAPAAPSQLVVPPTTVRVEPVKERVPQSAAPQPATPELTPEPAHQPPEAQPEMAGILRVSVSKGSGAPIKVEEGGAGPSDDLTRIDGIDSSMERRLREQGIRRLLDLAGLISADVSGLSESLHLGGRIERESWVGQAQILAAGGQTYYSRRVDHGVPVPEGVDPAAAIAAEAAPGPVVMPAAAPAASARVEPAPSAPAPVASSAPAPAQSAAAPAPQSAPVMAEAAPAPMSVPPAAAAPAEARPAQDMVHLRSVRSEALLGEEGARALRPAGVTDDLKRIRGIGVLIEKKLNSLGIAHYEQIANWTGADIERISRLLDFKGRIEREAWIEQARILATGGQTEFSRRGG